FLLLVMVVSFTRRLRPGMWIAVVLLSVWVAVHLHDWWIPYIGGTGPESDGFYSFYGNRTQVLPSFGRHRPPDGGHAVLDLFVFAAFLSALVSSSDRQPHCQVDDGSPCWLGGGFPERIVSQRLDGICWRSRAAEKSRRSQSLTVSAHNPF